MKFFGKNEVNKKIVIILFILLGFISLSVIIFSKIGLNSSEKESINIVDNDDNFELPSDNQEPPSNDTELSLEQKLKELDNRYNEYDLLYRDLLYRYEPYYMYVGWNYMEEYTPEKNTELNIDRKKWCTPLQWLRSGTRYGKK